ncbi:hypothetical protein B566_EDAN001222, partial [Ephemera danica]
MDMTVMVALEQAKFVSKTMNNRPNAGAGIFANAHDMDQEGLVAFTAMAEEAMKIERMVVQQKELTTKLGHQLQKLCSKEEKESEKYRNLHRDVHSFADKNRLLKENLQGKRDSRCMMEQMSADLERQLQLECNSIQNKIQNMAKTEHTYTEMIKKYESVYLSSAEAKEMKRMQNMKYSIISEIKCIESSIKAVKQEYKQKMITKEQDRNKLVLKTALLIGEHHELQAKLETKQALLQNLNEQVTKEQEEIEILQKQASINNTGMEGKEMVKEATGNVPEKEKRKIKDPKNMLNFATFTLPELQLPDLAMEHNDLILQDNFDLGYSEFLQGINEINDRSEQMEEEQPEAPLMVDLPQTAQTNIQEESTEPSQPVNQEIEMAEEVASNEPTTTEPSNDEVVAQPMDQEVENEALMSEQEEPQETQDQQQMQERETASQANSGRVMFGGQPQPTAPPQ